MESTASKTSMLEAIKDFDSSIPDEVIKHFLNISGMQTSDQKIIRLIAIAAQKFIHEIVSDSLQHCKLRNKGKKYTLTVEDLSAALSEVGIEMKRQQYFN
uniref:Transcription initiation factor TFIID subunit 10 n=1 Tax=Aceria tosichella TaxID=561515 RepID=A0A6G1SIP3_9ACAR